MVRDELITGPYTGPARSISQYRPLATSLSSLNTSLPLEKIFGVPLCSEDVDFDHEQRENCETVSNNNHLLI